MIIERRIKLNNFLILNVLKEISSDWNKYLNKHYDMTKIDIDFFELLDEFLNDYALNKTEKSD